MFWPSEERIYEGTVTVLNGPNGKRRFEVMYVDGDCQAYDEGDPELNPRNWAVVDPAEELHEASETLLSVMRAADVGTNYMLLLSMEQLVQKELKEFLAPKPVNVVDQYYRVSVEWSTTQHKYYFGTDADISVETDEQLAAVLFPISKHLSFKLIGHVRPETQRMQVCGPGLVRRSPKSTSLYITFSQFNLVDGEWERDSPVPDGAPGKRTKKAKKDNQ